MKSAFLDRRPGLTYHTQTFSYEGERLVKEQRRLAAIMFSDICGFTKIMGRDENLAISFVAEHEHVMKSAAASFGGRVIKNMGDGLLVGFGSAVNAVSCALAAQKHLKARNRHADEEQVFHIRIGIHVGDVVMSKNDILGDGVNIAARIEPLAQPGGICISGDVFEMVKNRMNVHATAMGSRRLKNVTRRVQIYGITLGKRRKTGGWTDFRLKFSRLKTGLEAGFHAHRKVVIAIAVAAAAAGFILAAAVYAVVLDRQAMKEYVRAKEQAQEFMAQKQPARAVWAMRSFPRRFHRTRWQSKVESELSNALEAAAKERIQERYYAFWRAVIDDQPRKVLQFVSPPERIGPDTAVRARALCLRMKHDQRHGTKFKIRSVDLRDDGKYATVNLQVSGPGSANGNEGWQDVPPSYWQLFEGDWYVCLEEPEKGLEKKDA